MGIKFYCPNGHKLNVKSFLSGKKAICPKCGAKVTVPAESQAPPPNAEADDQSSPENGSLGAPLAHPGAAAPAGNAQAAPASATMGTHGPNPAGLAQPAMTANALPAGWAGSGAAAGGGFGARAAGTAPLNAGAFNAAPIHPTALNPGTGAPQAAGSAPVAGFGGQAVRDAIDEAPTAVWYVRPASGGQFGPAPGETMRIWIDEGRVAATALVWRAGWPEWRSAAAIFPKLAASVAAPWGQAPAFGTAPVVGTGPAFGTGAVMPQAAGAWGGAGVGSAPAGVVSGPMAPVAPVGMAIAPVQPVGMGTPAGIPVGQVMGGAPAIEDFSMEEGDDRASRSRRRRQKSTDVTMVVSIILVILTIVLVAVLAIVLSRQTEPVTTPPTMYHGPKADPVKEKSETKAPAKKKEPAKKAPAKEKKSDAGMDDDSDFE